MDNTSRRGFFGAIGGVAAGAFVMLKTDVGEVKAVTDPKALKLITAPSGQLIDDIIVGAFGVPRDASYMIDFRRSGNPDVTQLQITLNARASFRWVPPPGREIRLGPGERLTWRIVYADTYLAFAEGDAESAGRRDWNVVVHTRGQCMATGKVVINQSEYA